MKILHVEDYFDPMAGYQINELLYASKDFDDEVFLITSNDMSPFHNKVDIYSDEKFEKRTSVKIYRLDSVVKISSRLILKDFNKTIKQINPDVLFMHGIGDFKDLQLWSNKRYYKVIRDCHMSWIASKNKFKNVYYLFYRIFFAEIINRTNKYDIIFALGDEEYEYLKKIGIKDNKIDFLRHGYNDSVMYYNESERNFIREQYGYEKDDIVISYIGKFNYSKRPDLVISIIDIFDKEFINNHKIKLLFIGSKDEEYIKKDFNIKVEGVKGKVQIITDNSKPYEELRKYYSASDICIFPKETTLSSIHAQVCGCSVIMEDQKSNIERVINSKNLYPADNLINASDILRKIIINKEFKKNKNINNVYFLKSRDYKNQVNKIRNIVYNV